jgi:RNA polymerase sigma factor (sigma-70 family)
VKNYSDAQLIQELRDDNHRAFQEIYDRYADKLIAAALKKTGNEEEAMDMVQELFLSVWKNRYTIQLNGMLEAYLNVSINYMIFRWYKKQKVQPQSLADIPERLEQYEDTTADKLVLSELNFLISREIAGMPEKMRQVYLYSRELDMTGPQIAAQLGVSHQTVRNQISNALRRLKKSVEKYYSVASIDNYSKFLLILIIFYFSLVQFR